MWDKEMGREGQVRKVNGEKQWVTGSPEWIGCENKEGLKHSAMGTQSNGPHFHTHTLTRLQNHLLHTFPAAHSQVDNKHFYLQGRLQIHSGERNKAAHQLEGHEARNNKENQLNTPKWGLKQTNGRVGNFPPHPLLKYPRKYLSLI